MSLRERRRAAGLTQAELARVARVPQPNLSAYETGRRAPSPQVQARLDVALRTRPSHRVDAHREAMREAVAHHHATNPRLVGSVARGDDTGDSDVDILVDFTDAATLLNEVGLRLALTEMLGVEVDVLDANHLPPPMRNRLLAEAVPL